MAVGTGNISLQDVVNEMITVEQDPNYLPTKSLATCFSPSIYNDVGFDATYNSPTDNRLSEFKGYDHAAVSYTYTANLAGPASFASGAGNYTLSVTFTSNPTGGPTSGITWSLSKNQNWVTFNDPVSNQTGNASISITVAGNLGVPGSTPPRDVTFSLSSTEGSDSITITQEGDIDGGE